jgi:hypothetical protein
MLHDPSADATPEPPVPVQPLADEPLPGEADVVEWGDDAFSPRRPRRRWGLLSRLDRLRGDRRLTPLAVAGLGLAAVFGSMVNEWATLHVRQTASEQFQPNEFTVGASNVGIDSGYLVGILAIVALTAVATLGTPPVRHNARIAGMATGAGLLVLLIAATVSLDATVDRMFGFGPDLEVDIRYGLGLTLAYAATASLGLALYLAGRPHGGPVPAADADREEPDEPHERRPPRRERAEHDKPVRDVTVLPAPPFTGPGWPEQYPR